MSAPAPSPAVRAALPHTAADWHALAPHQRAAVERLVLLMAKVRQYAPLADDSARVGGDTSHSPASGPGGSFSAGARGASPAPAADGMEEREPPANPIGGGATCDPNRDGAGWMGADALAEARALVGVVLATVLHYPEDVARKLAAKRIAKRALIWAEADYHGQPRAAVEADLRRRGIEPHDFARLPQFSHRTGEASPVPARGYFGRCVYGVK